LAFTENIAILMFLFLGSALGFAAEFIPRLFTKSRPTAEKLAPFESGEDPVGTARIRFRIQYYIYAVAFVAFDIVAALAIPWAVGWGYVYWTPIVALLVVMLAVVGYYSVKGDLEWT
jgi:NADH:ubiquinone oxidoreductase subunit 3 (subunit A)